MPYGIATKQGAERRVAASAWWTLSPVRDHIAGAMFLVGDDCCAICHLIRYGAPYPSIDQSWAWHNRRQVKIKQQISKQNLSVIQATNTPQYCI